MTLHLGVLTLYSPAEDRGEYHFFRRLSEAGGKMDMEILVFSPADADDSTERVSGLLYDAKPRKWRRVDRPLPGLIFDRCRFQRSNLFREMKSFRRRYAGRLTFLNHTLAHKWELHRMLAKHPAIASHLPETAAYRGVEQLKHLTGRYPAVYLKPTDGTGGRGIVCVSREEGGMFRLQGRSRIRSILGPIEVKNADVTAKLGQWGVNVQRRYLIQQGIPVTLQNGRVHDFRLLIQKDGGGRWEVTGCAGRQGPALSVTSNLHGGGSAAPMKKLLRHSFSVGEIREIELSMHQLASDTAEVLEKRFGSLCELALDLAVDPEGRVWLLEVNPKPSREVFKRIGETDVYRTAIRRPLEYARHLAETPVLPALPLAPY